MLINSVSLHLPLPTPLPQSVGCTEVSGTATAERKAELLQGQKSEGKPGEHYAQALQWRCVWFTLLEQRKDP